MAGQRSRTPREEQRLRTFETETPGLNRARASRVPVGQKIWRPGRGSAGGTSSALFHDAEGPGPSGPSAPLVPTEIPGCEIGHRLTVPPSILQALTPGQVLIEGIEGELVDEILH